MEVNLGRLRKNYGELRRFVDKKAAIIAVVKGNGYSFGVWPVVRTLLEEGCTRFAVATPEEAFTIRGHDASCSVLVLGPSPKSAIAEYIDKRIEVVCGDETFLGLLSEEGAAKNKPALVHYKIDTGLSRMGFYADEFLDKAKGFYGVKGVQAEGILSHLAVSDEGKNEFTEEQFRKFKNLTTELERNGFDLGIKHICNSAATIHYPEMHLDAVRVGKLLYGFWPYWSPSVPKPIESEYIFEVKSEIVHLRELPLGTPVGYGSRYTTRNREKIAIVPLGYHDGYTRLYSGKVSVLVHGSRVPAVGAICMDQTLVNVSDVPGVKVGDEVVIVGRQGNEKILPEELGALIGTSACEVTNLFRERVPRVYSE